MQLDKKNNQKVKAKYIKILVSVRFIKTERVLEIWVQKVEAKKD